MSLRELIGGSEVCRQLEALIDNRRLPHSVILECKDGEQAKAAAKELAKVCVCSSQGHRPCDSCINCRKAEQGIHPDIYTVNIVDKKQSVGVGEIREMISDCYIKPNEAASKVYFIFDKMTVEAQNALLKILEEPPQGVQFIITCESSSALLRTVLSRSTVFKLNYAQDAAVNELDRRAEELALEIAQAVVQNLEYPLLIATNKLSKDKQLAAKTLEKLNGYIILALEEKFIPTGRQPKHIMDLSRSLRKKSLVRLIDVMAQAQKMLTQNCNMNLLAVWLCANIRQSRH